ncbi:MAG TPA: TetR/AcrR family transcriptional regulator [Longimicrobiaceae bacterium]
MFKSTKTPKGEETKRRVHDAALALFREKGLDATTMRDVAAAAGMSLGAAYHYFPSKEAIVMAYYGAVQDEHDRRVQEAVRAHGALRDRLAAAFHSKLDMLGDDRRVLGALLRYTGEPEHPLSFLGPATRPIQLRSIATFALPLRNADVPPDFRATAALMLWAMHMGILLYFLYDGSPGQQRTHRLADGGIALFISTLKLARLPLLRSLRTRLTALLDEAGLLPDLSAAEAAPAPG